MIPRATVEGGYQISRIIKGGWHLAGDHGSIDRAQALLDMASFVEAGVTTFDCADIYTGVEQLIGDFRRAYPDLAERVQIHTKFVPDLADLSRVDRRYVETIIDRSLARLGVEQIDLVQFHWWDYAVPGHIDTALELQLQRDAGKIARLGVNLATHQVQYSLLDLRPEHGMVELCGRRAIGLLCYGTVAGGFMSERWLGAPEPPDTPTNRSLIKYKLIIDDFGGWECFQALLRALSDVARKHGCDIATVATAAILEKPQVAATIVGATNTNHLAAHQRIGSLRLDDEDRAILAGVTAGAKGPEGDVYSLERDREGPHGRIMKYELNKG